MYNDSTKIQHPRHAALFDLDGVLVDSEGIYTQFWAEIDKKYPTGVKDFAHVIKGNTMARILDTYFPVSLHPTLHSLLKQQEEDMRYELYDGVQTLLSKIRNLNWRIAIVTSSNNTKMDNLFRQIPQLRPLVDVLVTDGDVTRGKPDPQGYLLAAQRLDCDPEDCVVFEDSLSGLEAGRRSGARVVGVATTNPHNVVAPLCDYCIDSIADFSTEWL